jgi:beta-N-acetylhexosaminidase
MAGFAGLEPSAGLKHLLRRHAGGAVSLFARNVAGPAPVAELVRELQALARDAGQDLPLLVAVDQEGGRVQRLGEPWTVWPPMRALGLLDSEATAERVGQALARELAACGIRWNLAPVLDVDSNPRNPVIGDRAFGSEPERVARLGTAVIRGMQGGGVAACAKHFPGHGDTEVDSHLELPALDHARGRLDDVELRPFRRAIEAGVASVMTAHVLLRELDDGLPATLSPRVVDAVLRRELGYDGVVVADDLEMKAIAKRWSPARAAVLAAQAGCDVVPFCSSPDAQLEALEGLIRAIESGAISWSALDDSLRRIRGLKERYVLPYRAPDPKLARQAAGTGESLALAAEIADRAGLRTA